MQGEKVKHKRYGVGTILYYNTTHNTVTVQYSDGKSVVYDYPKDFNLGIIEFVDSSLQAAATKNGYVSTQPKKTGTKLSSSRIGMNPSTVTTLQRGVSYGTNSKEIYVALCKNPKYNWDIKLQDHFGHQGADMYAETGDGESGVWFIANTTNQGVIQPSGLWWNTIINDEIHEYCKNTDCSANEFSAEQGHKRIIFVRNPKGEYEFYGVYIGVIVNNTVRPFERKYVLVSPTL